MARHDSNRFARWVNSPRVAAVLLALTALGCGAGAVYGNSQESALRDRGVVTTAEVIAVRDHVKDHVVTVRFRLASGREVTEEVGDYLWRPTPRVGDRPRILYDPQDPSNNADVRLGTDFFTVWFLGAAAVVAALLIWPTWTGALDWNRLRPT